jgi:hypothetical protein
MVRAEDQTIFGSVNEAKTAECRVCGKNLKFKDQNQEGTDVKVTQAKHCGTIYTIVQSGNTTISAVRDPKFIEKENKINEKRQKAAQLRRKGKSEEAAKLDEEVDKEFDDLAKEEETEEPKTDAGGRRTASLEEEKRGVKRM